ncbi:LytTR family DNA-binding domain-containing protein [Flavivirga eckloniae]|uniref:LytTR family DNA-binding domain-containing protein n=1 Tax=Flavivirga eckloniae TaxID=1803846 RepID=UPI0013155200|nr:LytTR family DNA-binding domain-containing protein [Flavivirga eckloniae]
MTNFNYHDKNFGWIIYPILGVSFTIFANDNDFETLIQIPSFKWDIVFSLFVVSIIGFYLAWLVRHLDKSKDLSWEKNFSKRAIIQFIYGVAAPLTLALGLELVYLNIINVDLNQSSILNLELPLAFLYLFILNLLYYLNYVSVAYRKKLEEKDASKLFEEKVKVSVGAKESLIPIKNIAFLKSEDKVLWLYTFEDKQLHISGTLNDWKLRLPNEYFYRLNRQIIVNRDAIEGLESTETRRLKVFLKNTDDDIYLPKSKVTDFRKWWKS